jgi:hypothetical protein
MKIIGIGTAALAAATAIGISGAALAAPAGNLSQGHQTARDDKGAVQQAYHRHHYGYYYSPYYYRPYYRPYYSPYYYGGPSFNFGIHIR